MGEVLQKWHFLKSHSKFYSEVTVVLLLKTWNFWFFLALSYVVDFDMVSLHEIIGIMFLSWTLFLFTHMMYVESS